jgi:tetratricopeptide (TPR) repeat protein
MSGSSRLNRLYAFSKHPSSLAVAALFMFVCLVLAWSPAASAPYQYDDYVTPVKDPASQSLESWARALPRTLRPLTKLSYAIESSLGADSAPARRVFNALTFAGAAALLALLARALGVGWFGALGLSTAWACHPAHAETVVALAGRSVLLALALTLASAALWFWNRPRAAIAFALLAVLARETAVLWFVICVALVVRSRAPSRARWIATVAGSALLGALVVLASSRWRALLAFSFSGPSVANRLGLQWAAISRETWLFFAEPTRFSVDMDFAPVAGERLFYVLASAGLYALAVALALHPRSSRGLRLAALFWLSWVLPLHSIVPKLDPLTARSVSASSAAWVLIAASLGASSNARFRDARFWIAGIAWVSTTLLIPITRERARLYQDPVALWRDAAEQSRNSTRPLVNLGTLLAQRGDLEEAQKVLERAVRRDASNLEARARLSSVLTLIETKKLLTPPRSRD